MPAQTPGPIAPVSGVGATPVSADYWNPPTSESQHARQRILTVIVAFVLAAILAQAGW